MIDSVKIGLVTYTVEEKADLYQLTDGRKEALHGEIWHAEAAINLEANQNVDVKLVTLWHEILHGILHSAGHENHPEPTIIALSYGLVQILRDNPKLIEQTMFGERREMVLSEATRRLFYGNDYLHAPLNGHSSEE